MMRLCQLRVLLAMAACLGALPAAAHPHVWVVSKSKIILDKGAVSAIEQSWTFDEFYSTMAVQGLDTNNDGQYSKEELAELAKINMEGLKEFAYFTALKSGADTLAPGTPTDAYLDYTGGILTLNFKLPLQKPADVKDFSFATYDSSFYIAFEPAKDDPVTIAGGLPSCAVQLRDGEAGAAGAAAPADAANQTLTGAFAQQFGGASVLSTKWASVQCKNS